MNEVTDTFGFSFGDMATGLVLGGFAWFVVRCILTGFFTVNQNERAVKLVFGRAKRLKEGATTKTGPMSEGLTTHDENRYVYPVLEVIRPGGPYFKWPWEKIVKVSVATETVSMAYDPESKMANSGGRELDAVTKDQLNVSLTGQLRYRISENNLYAYLFGVKRPIAHVMGYFISILRQRIASFEAPADPNAIGGSQPLDATAVSGVSINDLRKNLRDLNEHMDLECKGSEARYGIVLDASLITSIGAPGEVESALAAINTAHNHVSSDVSLAQAAADQKLVLSRRAVEIETLKAQAEVEPLVAMAEQLKLLKMSGPTSLKAYVRNARLNLFQKASQVVLGVKP
ncbi:MAG: SPFH domain-containing protein [Myxococcaceae bacterium]